MPWIYELRPSFFRERADLRSAEDVFGNVSRCHVGITFSKKRVCPIRSAGADPMGQGAGGAHLRGAHLPGELAMASLKRYLEKSAGVKARLRSLLAARLASFRSARGPVPSVSRKMRTVSAGPTCPSSSALNAPALIS